jgi:glycosyltransferase involved in cell wall biosynthesis
MKSLKDQGLKDYKLLLIGHGPLKEHVMRDCEELGLNDCVIFLGNRNDVPRIMMAMDIFCMPSLYEGFPITSVEAQATGLPLLMSKNVSPEVCITDLVKLLPIDQSTSIWEEEIKHVDMAEKERNIYADKIKNAGYDIRHSASMLESIYNK